MTAPNVEYRIGDCIEVLDEFPEDHFDSCVTDPPYGLAFMGKAWDTVELYPFTMGWAKAVYRVLKPGAWLLSFGGTRTYHRMTCALEDVGFEVRDCMMWLYGSGFPKSLDISKALDKRAGAEREIVGRGCRDVELLGPLEIGDSSRSQTGAPATQDAIKWQGWGTALKPAWEPIVVCRKPLIGTVVDNILKHGTGGINVDGCRIDYRNECDEGAARGIREMGREHHSKESRTVNFGMNPLCERGSLLGRWPSNILLDEDSAKLVDEMSGELTSGSRAEGVRTGIGYFGGKGDGGPAIDGDTGGASRFFYTAKASRSEREKGLEKMPSAKVGVFEGNQDGSLGGPIPVAKNFHPTVKPLDLMQYLVRLVTPKGGICLDPFLGSGTTMLACRLEGFSGLGIEKNAEYEPVIRGRLEYIPPALESFEVAPDV